MIKRIAIILLLINATSLSMVYAQTSNDFRAEEFIVKVFYGDMTEKSKTVYLDRYAYSGSNGFDYEKFSLLCRSLMPDLSDDEMREAFVGYKNSSRLWNENALVFQQPKYKKLIFVDDIFTLLKRKQKRAELRRFSKPLFIKDKDGEYAFVVESYGLFYQSSGWNWRKPWKSFKSGIRMHFLTEDRLKAYRLIEGKWVYITDIQMDSGHF